MLYISNQHFEKRISEILKFFRNYAIFTNDLLKFLIKLILLLIVNIQ